MVPNGTIHFLVHPPAPASRGTWHPRGRSIGDRKQAAVYAKRERPMLEWALIFLVIAIVAGGLGFGGVASSATGIAQVLFGLFLLLFFVSLVLHVVRGPSPPL
jgi:uncharacterized membrane protein YtjA (UPF0391 family)